MGQIFVANTGGVSSKEGAATCMAMERILTNFCDEVTEGRSSARVEEEGFELHVGGWIGNCKRAGRTEVCCRCVTLFCILFVRYF